jgi:hypothetical protein
MAKAATQPAPSLERRKLAEQLVDTQIKHRKIFELVDGLKAGLKLVATAAGDGFREVFAGRGQVSVSAGRDKEFLGDLPELDVDRWAELTDKQRCALLERGIVKMVPTHKQAYHGRVEVKLF